MSDQAAGLRSLFARRRPSLVIVAGSDAAKAAIAVHFAREAALSGRATLIVDGTAGQVATACDLSCRFELSHVVAGDVPLSDVLRMLTPHLLLLPAARALSRFGAFGPDEQARLTDAFSNGIAQALAASGSETQVDLIVVNAEAGHAARAVEAFGRDARVVIVASDHGTSLCGAYFEMKDLAQQHGLENFEIVAPCFDATAPRGIAFANLASAARRFLDIELVDGGTVTLSAAHHADAASSSTQAPRGATAAVASATSAPSSSSPLTSEEEVPHAAIA